MRRGNETNPHQTKENLLFRSPEATGGVDFIRFWRMKFLKNSPPMIKVNRKRKICFVFY
jgi:hypothetical protein